MAGYSRAFDKNAGDRIDAEDFNDEYEAITAAFNTANGHNHDGTVGSGGLVPFISDVNRRTYVEVNAPSQEIAFSTEFGGGAEIQLYLRNGVLAPRLDVDVDFGTPTERIKNIYVQDTNSHNLSLAAGVAVSGILDEDDFASNSVFALATQQSIKSYVDSTVDAAPGIFSKVEISRQTTDLALSGAMADYITASFEVENNGSYVVAIGSVTALGQDFAGAILARLYQDLSPLGSEDTYVAYHTADGEDFYGSVTIAERIGPFAAGTYTFSIKMREQGTHGIAQNATLILMEETV